MQAVAFVTCDDCVCSLQAWPRGLLSASSSCTTCDHLAEMFSSNILVLFTAGPSMNTKGMLMYVVLPVDHALRMDTIMAPSSR